MIYREIQATRQVETALEEVERAHDQVYAMLILTEGSSFEDAFPALMESLRVSYAKLGELRCKLGLGVPPAGEELPEDERPTQPARPRTPGVPR